MRRAVLYIDDQSELPENVDDLLAQTGHRLVHTADPDEALRVVREEPPALVLIEVLLPGCDAFELIERIGAARPEAPTPVVVVTRGERSSQLYGRALELGAKDFLCKPVVRAEILEAVLAFADDTEPAAPATAATNPQAPPPEPTQPALRKFKGTLANLPLAELLGRLSRAGLSGVLHLRWGSEKRSLELRNGSPIEMARPNSIMPIGDFLLERGQINETQYEMLVDQLMAGIGGPRAILRGMDAISEEALVVASQEQARDALFEILRWSAGKYAFREGDRLDETDRLELACEPSEILVAGMNNAPYEVVTRAVEARRGLYVSLSARAPGCLDALGLAPELREDVESLTGEFTLADILETSSIDARTFFGLCASGALELEEHAVLTLEEELKPETGEVFEELPESLGPITEARRSSRADLGSIEATIHHIDNLTSSEDDFEIFGIHDRSSDSDVRAAHDRLLSSLGLASIPSELEELRALATRVKTRLEQAYQRVRTRDSRRAFAGLRKKKTTPVETEEAPNVEETEGARLVEAETWFRKGKAALSRDEFHEAVESFGMAMHCDPGQGDYPAYLGYALYRTDPTNSVIRREALEHVANGVKRAPDRGMPLLFLGRIFREQGDKAMALKVLRRAQRIDPDNLGIVQEICLLDASEAKNAKRGFIARMRGR